MRHARPASTALFLLGALLAQEPTRAAAQAADPFSPQTRWSCAASTASAWMPASVGFAAHGELVFAAGSLASPRWMLFSTPQATSGSVAAGCSSLAAPSTLSNMSVRGGDQGSELFSLSQQPDPDPAHRKTLVARHDALLHSGVLAQAWSHDMGWRVNGSAKLAAAADGSRAVAVLHDAAAGALRIDWLDGQSGALARRLDFNAGMLRQLSASADCARVAIAAGLELWIFDDGGNTLHHENLGAAAQALALSGDGQTLLVGAPGQLRVLAWAGTGFVQRALESAASAQIPVRCAISHDGQTWAAGWWDSVSGRDLRLELRGAPSDSLVWQEQQQGPALGPQNYPEVVCITRDGARAAFGSWGSSDAQAEVLLVDRASAASVARLDLPGSVLAMDLDPSGTRLAIGMKHAHANSWANTGELQLFDSGERELQSLDQARWGQPLPLCARRAGARSIWFLYGARSATPRAVFGVSGSLWISRAGLNLLRVPADASGRADASLPVPWSPSSSGVPFSVQTIFRAPGATGLSTVVLDPVAL